MMGNCFIRAYSLKPNFTLLRCNTKSDLESGNEIFDSLNLSFFKFKVVGEFSGCLRNQFKHMSSKEYFKDYRLERLDALRRTDAGEPGTNAAVPALFLAIPAGVKISTDLVRQASRDGVGLFHCL